MATCSITDDIIIDDPKAVERLVELLEEGESLSAQADRAATVGQALKLISNRMQNTGASIDKEPCRKYGCLECKHFQRKEGYDHEWGRFAFFYYKCKKQPNRNMYDHENQYSIFDIEPDYSPHFHYDTAKGECPYFEEGENELIYMSKEEKCNCLNV